ncbi:MAG: immunoglobulin domain-containing protein [FCB group bacterium]
MPIQDITVSGGSGSVSITSPVGGESWCKSTSQNITWTYSGISNVKIELSTDGGSSFPTTLIASTAASAQSWSWSIPSNQTTCTTNKIRISDASNPSTSSTSPGNFTIADATNITSQPQSLTKCTGQSAAFSISATGSSLTYQWRKNSSNISGATSSNYTISSVSSGDAANYDCVVTGGCGSPVTSNQATLTVNTSPSISQNPSSQSVCEGQAASFSVTASGTGLTYQWRKNGTNITNATTSTYAISSVATSDGGNYDCVVNGTCGSPQTSNQATLTVNTKPNITQNPSNQTLCEGQAASFSVTATGTGLSYQWRKNSTNITNATTSTYAISSVATTDAANYDCVVNGTCNNPQTSNQATLTINSNPKITQNPSNQTLCEGQAASFSITASGTGLTYQWRKNSSNIQNATTSTYAIASVASTDAGNYDCVVNGTCNSPQTSSQATLTVNSAPKITQNPSSQTLCEGQAASFSVTATGTGLTYQWRINAVNIQNATTSTYAIASIATTDAGNYDCVVNGTCNSPQTSNQAVLTINANPKITQNPITQTTCVGQPAAFNIVATGAGLTYQWRKNGTNITNANASSYSIQTATTNDAGNYDCVVNGTCNNPQTSPQVALTISDLPTISQNPMSQTVCEGKSVLFTITASAPGITYQWRKNSVNISNANASNYTIQNVTSNDAGNYDCVVNGTCNNPTTSSPANLTINYLPKIVQQPKDVSICDVTTATFKVSATGSAIQYQWRKDGIIIPNQINDSLVITNLDISKNGKYDVIVSGSCEPSDTSVSCLLNFNMKPVITNQPMSQTVSAGTDIDINVSASGKDLTYKWQKDNTDLSGQTTNDLHIHGAKTLDGGDYKCIVTDACGSVTSNVATLTVSNITSGPILTLTNSAVDFGTVIVNNKQDTVISGLLKNTGTSDLIISDITFVPTTDEFSIINEPSLPLSIKAGSSVDLSIRFKPTTQGVKNVVITFKSNSSTTPNLNLTGTGGLFNLVVSQSTVNFYSSDIGIPVTKNVTIQNQGNIDVDISLAITGPNAERYSIQSPNYSIDDLINLPKDSSVILGIQFNPGDKNEADAQLEIKSALETQPEIIKLIGAISITPVIEANNFISELKVYPIPASKELNIEFGIPKSALLDIFIYNMRGELIMSLGRFNVEAGMNKLTWNGLDEPGNVLPSGTYNLLIRSINSYKSYMFVILK